MLDGDIGVVLVIVVVFELLEEGFHFDAVEVCGEGFEGVVFQIVSKGVSAKVVNVGGHCVFFHGGQDADLEDVQVYFGLLKFRSSLS